jgi:hypothetical protein
VSETVNLSSERALVSIQDGSLWRTMQDCLIDGHLLSCSLSLRRRRSDSVGGGGRGKGGGPGGEFLGPKGLLVNHGYAILDVRVCC